jgi:hypothetical protein
MFNRRRFIGSDSFLSDSPLLVEVDLPLASKPLLRRYGYVDLTGSAFQNHDAFEKMMARSFKAGEALQALF